MQWLGFGRSKCSAAAAAQQAQIASALLLVCLFLPFWRFYSLFTESIQPVVFAQPSSVIIFCYTVSFCPVCLQSSRRNTIGISRFFWISTCHVPSETVAHLSACFPSPPCLPQVNWVWTLKYDHAARVTCQSDTASLIGASIFHCTKCTRCKCCL